MVNDGISNNLENLARKQKTLSLSSAITKDHCFSVYILLYVVESISFHVS